MGIDNVNILIQPDLSYRQERQQEVAARIAGELIRDHKAGKHPWGEKRRNCPLCQEGK